jgi:selenide,water dikinase
MKKVGVHACTDVSGFGLAGHLGEMLDASRVGARLRLEDVPLHDLVLELIAREVYADGLRSNRDHALPRFGAALGAGGAALEPRVLALFDPQTSGGLLMTVSRAKLAWLLAELEEAGATGWLIGETTDGPAGSIELA